MNRHDDNDVAEDNGLMGVDPGVAMSGDFPGLWRCSERCVNPNFFFVPTDDIAMDYVAFDLAFHPECDVLCTGNIEGNIDWCASQRRPFAHAPAQLQVFERRERAGLVDQCARKCCASDRLLGRRHSSVGCVATLLFC